MLEAVRMCRKTVLRVPGWGQTVLLLSLLWRPGPLHAEKSDGPTADTPATSASMQSSSESASDAEFAVQSPDQAYSPVVRRLLTLAQGPGLTDIYASPETMLVLYSGILQASRWAEQHPAASANARYLRRLLLQLGQECRNLLVIPEQLRADNDRAGTTETGSETRGSTNSNSPLLFSPAPVLSMDAAAIWQWSDALVSSTLTLDSLSPELDAEHHSYLLALLQQQTNPFAPGVGVTSMIMRLVVALRETRARVPEKRRALVEQRAERAALSGLLAIHDWTDQQLKNLNKKARQAALRQYNDDPRVRAEIERSNRSARRRIHAIKSRARDDSGNAADDESTGMLVAPVEAKSTWSSAAEQHLDRLQRLDRRYARALRALPDVAELVARQQGLLEQFMQPVLGHAAQARAVSWLGGNSQAGKTTVVPGLEQRQQSAAERELRQLLAQSLERGPRWTSLRFHAMRIAYRSQARQRQYTHPMADEVFLSRELRAATKHNASFQQLMTSIFGALEAVEVGLPTELETLSELRKAALAQAGRRGRVLARIAAEIDRMETQFAEQTRRPAPTELLWDLPVGASANPVRADDDKPSLKIFAEYLQSHHQALDIAGARQRLAQARKNAARALIHRSQAVGFEEYASRTLSMWSDRSRQIADAIASGVPVFRTPPLLLPTRKPPTAAPESGSRRWGVESSRRE